MLGTNDNGPSSGDGPVFGVLASVIPMRPPLLRLLCAALLLTQCATSGFEKARREDTSDAYREFLRRIGTCASSDFVADHPLWLAVCICGGRGSRICLAFRLVDSV